VARAGGHAEVVADGWQGKKEEHVKKTQISHIRNQNL
jgi:hypothetical protein